MIDMRLLLLLWAVDPRPLIGTVTFEGLFAVENTFGDQSSTERVAPESSRSIEAPQLLYRGAVCRWAL